MSSFRIDTLVTYQHTTMNWEEGNATSFERFYVLSDLSWFWCSDWSSVHVVSKYSSEDRNNHHEGISTVESTCNNWSVIAANDQRDARRKKKNKHTNQRQRLPSRWCGFNKHNEKDNVAQENADTWWNTQRNAKWKRMSHLSFLPAADFNCAW